MRLTMCSFGRRWIWIGSNLFGALGNLVIAVRWHHGRLD